MSSIQKIRRFQVFGICFSLAFIAFQGMALAQEQQTNDRLYVNEKYMYTLELPPGFTAWEDEQTKELFRESRETVELPEEIDKEKAEKQPIFKTVFQPSGSNISQQSLVVHAGLPAQKSLEEFERAFSAGDMDFVILKKEALTINYRPCFLIDREFDRQGMRFRQLLAYVPGIGQAGYLLTYSAVSVDFDEFRDSFLKSLKTFKVQPPKEVPPELKQAKYSRKLQNPNEEKPAWRSIEVIGSFILVAIIVIWFMLRRLSAGAKEEGVGTLPGQAPPAEEETQAHHDRPDKGSGNGK
ncbi:MAG: hypothetical protein ABIK28_20025 [Planctomycetota bacterium]